MAFTEDLTQFFDTDDFAVPATIGASTVNVIFDNQFLGVPGEPVIAGSQPMAHGSTTEFTAASVAIQTSIVIGGITYVVTGIHPDGTGTTTLMLRR